MKDQSKENLKENLKVNSKEITRGNKSVKEPAEGSSKEERKKDFSGVHGARKSTGLSHKPWFDYAAAICIGVAFYAVILHLNILGRICLGIWKIFSPLVIGAVIAYLIDPFAALLRRSVFGKVKNKSVQNGLSVGIAFAAVVAAFAGLGVLIVPQLAAGITGFVDALGSYRATAGTLLEQFGIEIDLSSLADFEQNLVETIRDFVVQNQDTILSRSAQVGSGLTTFLLGFILAIYLELDRERLLKAGKELLKLLLSDKNYRDTSRFLGRCNKILLRYVICDLLEGLIVGVANAVFMVICGMPYIALISVVVGVTNMAPTFGPIVGAVIGAFVLLMANPLYAAVFLIFTLILQTVDGYIIKPRLFGSTLGVSSLLILVMIVVGGRMFGVIGILLAIPFAAIIDFVYSDFLLPRLRKRKNGF